MRQTTMKPDVRYDGRTDAMDRPLTADEVVTTLYASHWSAMVRLAALLTGDRSVAEDVAADAFVALHRHWRGVRDPQAAPGYLRRSVVNASRSRLRHRGVARRLAPEPPPDVDSAEIGALAILRQEELLRAVRQLPRRQREVVVLRYWADLSEADIADALGISPGAVKSHAHRALAALRTRPEVTA